MTPRGKLVFRYRETMISQLKVQKKTLDFFFFKAERRTPRLIFADSSFDSFANPFHSWSSNGLHHTFEHGLHHSFGHVWSMYRSSPFRSTLNTGYITALDMCEVCTEAVHSVAPWTRVTSQLWTSVKYEPPSDTFVHISTTLTRFYVSRTILRLHFRAAWFQIRQPFHDSIFGTRQIRQPFQGRRISRVPKTTTFCETVVESLSSGIIELPIFLGMKQCKSMVVLKDFPLILHGLGW